MPTMVLAAPGFLCLCHAVLLREGEEPSFFMTSCAICCLFAVLLFRAGQSFSGGTPVGMSRDVSVGTFYRSDSGWVLSGRLDVVWSAGSCLVVCFVEFFNNVFSVAPNARNTRNAEISRTGRPGQNIS